MTVSYPKKMREQAKKDGKGLLTLDVPGMTFQTPATPEEIVLVYKVFQEITEKRANDKGT